MKLLVIGTESQFRKNVTDPKFYETFETHFVPGGSDDEVIVATCPDADLIIVDAVRPVSKYVIDHLPNLKLVHSRGVAFNWIDTEAAKARQIPVCNCKGINAKPVAEQTVFLAGSLLRGMITGDRAFREGRCLAVKEAHMLQGTMLEIADCKVGLYGFGDIAREAAKMFNCLGAEVYYYDVFRASPEVEADYGVTYVELDELAKISDIFSVHVPVTPQTTNAINADFFKMMKNTAYIVNTARGEIIDELALIDALRTGEIAGAGLDAVCYETEMEKSPFLNLEPELADKFVFSCHVGGITVSSFKRGTAALLKNCYALLNGQPLNHVVNQW